MEGRRRLRIRLRGIVQGVGFRPFVYKLAGELGLAGYVRNSSAGLVAEVEGEPEAVLRFGERVVREAPALAWIQSCETEGIAAEGGSDFAIRESESRAGEFALVSPDVATCEDCVRDFRDPRNRRYALPVHQLHQLRAALHHHPRHSLRPAEYDHGRVPHVPGVPGASTTIRATDGSTRSRTPAPFAGRSFRGRSRRRGGGWRRGRSWRSKGWAAFTWPAMPGTRRAVAALRQRKRRSDKPFAIMARDLEAAEAIVRGFAGGAASVLLGSRRPIVIMPRRESALPERWRQGTGRWA